MTVAELAEALRDYNGKVRIAVEGVHGDQTVYYDLDAVDTIHLGAEDCIALVIGAMHPESLKEVYDIPQE